MLLFTYLDQWPRCSLMQCGTGGYFPGKKSGGTLQYIRQPRNKAQLFSSQCSCVHPVPGTNPQYRESTVQRVPGEVRYFPMFGLLPWALKGSAEMSRFRWWICLRNHQRWWISYWESEKWQMLHRAYRLVLDVAFLGNFNSVKIVKVTLKCKCSLISW